MVGSVERWLRGFLVLGEEEASFRRRGFRSDRPKIRARLEASGRAFVCGFNEALLDPDPLVLSSRFARVERELRGFAFEGAAMAITILDQLAPRRGRRLEAFLS